ncbi:tetratricopeptide repeat protein [Desulfococcus sp.]|uniref:tetratricopeptide repeat protein n=1 Tax=Desulfococcus sp. TaxID=2025834 RepID=UPI003593DB33
MRPVSKLLVIPCCAALTVLLASVSAWAAPRSGQAAPMFAGAGVDGKSYDLSVLKSRPMAVLYFFDAASPSSRDGLASLGQICRRFKGTDLAVWGITRSPRQGVADFVSQNAVDFPILLDAEGISDLYGARVILPTVYILGPGLTVMDYFQGGGKSTEVMLVRLAERNLQRKETALAKAITREVADKNPRNVEARSVEAYAAIQEGNLKEAEDISKKMIASKGEGEILGKEVAAVVYAKTGQTDRAARLAGELERKAPGRVQAQVIQGDILYSRNQKAAAEEKYRKAAAKPEGSPTQKAQARNQLGRFYASLGEYKEARGLYDQAVEIDPYYVEATSNKGVTYEKEGQWDQALASYRSTLALDKGDMIASVLAGKAEEMIALNQDRSRKERIDKLVKELAERYRRQKQSPQKGEEDTWTSRPMVLTLMDFQEKGGLSERDGLSTALAVQLGDRLNASGRVKAVERTLIEHLLEELNLGSSELADPNTALRLGKVLAAKLIGTGTLHHMPDGTLFNLRLIDTETSAVPKVITRRLPAGGSLEEELNRLNRELLHAVIEKYPLRGFVVEVQGEEALLNIGEAQGVVLGTRFEILDAPKRIQYKGKTLEGTATPIGLIEVVAVEKEFCRGRITKKARALKRDDQVQEKIDPFVSEG